MDSVKENYKVEISHRRRELQGNYNKNNRTKIQRVSSIRRIL